MNVSSTKHKMITRSRKGCLSCKKLKIKCNEAKPTCEYCESTGRQCHYPDIEINQTSFGTIRKRGLRRRNHDKTLVAGMKLNSTTKLLQINLLELHLLKFFHERCVPFFSFFGADKDIEHAWTHSVPTIFSQSLLVRNAIYLFSALTLWPLYNIDDSLSLDKISKLLKYDQAVLLGKNGIASGVTKKDISTSVTDMTRTSLFEITTEYFISTLKENQQVIAKHYQGPVVKIKKFANVNEAAELAITSILLFTYMGLHPEGVLPIVVFNDDTQVDFISLSRNIGNIMVSTRDTLKDSEFGGLFARHYKFKNTKVLRDRYCITKSLFRKLDEYFYDISHTLEIDLASELDYDTLRTTIDIMNHCLYQTEVCNFPIGMYTWILLVPDHYYDLVKNKHPFATKMLFVYSCLNLIFDFAFTRSKSSFTKFAHWYRDNMILDEFDKKLYHVALDHDYQFTEDNFSSIRDFDPILFSDDLDNIAKDVIYDWLS
mmetsp:Transcript_5631/g.7121  ORF Transcript_5631/g.7121 Transcript_5631/m.7121 type:complete len:486 (-) Transcript_5631:620-2077(-)